MLKVRNYSIGQKLTWMNMLVSGAALLLACTAFAFFELADFRQTLAQGLSIQARIVGANSASALLFNDPASAGNTLSALKAAPNIVSASIYAPSGKVFATYSRDGGAVLPLGQTPKFENQTEEYRFTADELILAQPIEFQGKRIGTVGIRSDLREVNARLVRYAGIVTLVLLVSLLAAFLFSSIFQKATARPIGAQLAETARIVSREKRYSIRAPVTTNADEIAVLIDAFNEMLAQIQERDSARQAGGAALELWGVRRPAKREAVRRGLEAFTYSVAHDSACSPAPHSGLC